MAQLDRIPTRAADISPAWLTAVLGEAGLTVAIVDLAIEPIGTGQMASSLRVTPAYADGPGTTVAPGAPASVVVKMASDDPNSRGAGARGAYLKEVRFYQRMADSLPAATPHVFWADIDLDRNDFAIVLEDLRPGRQGDQIAGCDVESVRLAARNIAGLHAPHWCDPALYDTGWLTAPIDRLEQSRADTKALVAMLTPGFIDRYDGRLESDQIELLHWFAENVDTWLADDGGRFGLVHGDHRLDNLIFDPSHATRPVTVVDWQTVGVRNPLTDMAYLLGTSLEPDVRRRVEREIVADYRAQLESLGVRDYGMDLCFDDYRRQTPHALLLCVLGSMLTVQTARGDDMFMAMLRRGCTQITDLYPV